MKMTERNTVSISSIIYGRVEPLIYAFKTTTVPNHLKVGDTYRPLSMRLKEWGKIYADLEKVCDRSACVDDKLYFRDHEVHKYLKDSKQKQPIEPAEFPDLPKVSREFFKDTQPADVDEAIDEINESIKRGENIYNSLSLTELRETLKRKNEQEPYKRDQAYPLRLNQKAVVDKFNSARDNNRTNLLMFAVMRFGKSFTAMHCALSMDANLVLIVSAKTDVRDEWQKTIQSHRDFKDYEYITSSNLKQNNSLITDLRTSGKKVVLFLSLQDLNSSKIKRHHTEVFELMWNLVIVDETHFGAHADKYGKVLTAPGKLGKEVKVDSAENKRALQGVDTLDSVENLTKDLKRCITLHLSGTPYRLLMKNTEFNEKEGDIIAAVEYSDIAAARDEWFEAHADDDSMEDWDNPYYGFPEMVRFGLTPNQASLQRLEELKAQNGTTAFSELFRPKSLTPKNSEYLKFIHEDVVIEFLKVIDGSRQDENVLSFLNEDCIKKGKLCRHIVMVLPQCASCDAMEHLINTNSSIFKNLSEYEIINVSGVGKSVRLQKPEQYKLYISKCESKGQKTLTLTVNRMLTGVTIPEWDTMLFLKNTASPQEYDQAAFRLQSQFIKEYGTDNEDETDKRRVIKLNMKPQTIFVDFDPQRMFRLQKEKALILNMNTGSTGNQEIEKSMEREMKYSPIITMDNRMLCRVTPTNILDAIRDYASTRSVLDEATELHIDLSLLDDSEIRKTISALNPIGSKAGLGTKTSAHKDDGEGKNIDSHIHDENLGDITGNDSGRSGQADSQEDSEKELAKKFASYYALILFFAFLTEDNVSTLEEIINTLHASADNKRLSQSLGLDKEILTRIRSKINGRILSVIDDKIKNINELNRDTDKSPIEKAKLALTKFSRISESEIVTPLNIASEMVGELPDDILDKGPVLDIASKQGEFAVALFLRFGTTASNNVYSVCTSALAYEFTRKVYKLLGLSVEHIYSDFTSYDLIKEPENKELLNQLKDMNFSAIIGNPPYNEETIRTSDKPIYHKFIDYSISVSQRFVLITPGRFMSMAGKTPKSWNKKMLTDQHLKVVWHRNTNEVFPDAVDVKGGIMVTSYDMNITRKPIKNYSKYKELNSIRERIIERDDFVDIDSIIHIQNKFNLTFLYTWKPEIKKSIGSKGKERRLTTNIFALTELFSAINTPNTYKILGLINGKRVYRYIKKDFIAKKSNIDSYKVLIPKSNGEGQLGDVLSSPLIGEPGVGFTQSFISFGTFKKESEAKACLKYLCTKFARALLGILKTTQDNNKGKFKYVPLQDFSENNREIDWSMSVEEINQRLYEIYELSEEERDFIDKMIKPM